MSSSREKRKHRAIDNYHEEPVASASTTEDASSSSRRKQKSTVNTSSFGTNNGSSSSSHSSANNRRRRDVHRKRPRSSSNYHENEDSNHKRRRVTYHSSNSSSSASSSSSPSASSASSSSNNNALSPNTLTARANRRRILEERASPQEDFDTSLFYQPSPTSPIQSSPSPIIEREPSPAYEFSPSHDDFLIPGLDFDEDRIENTDSNVDGGEDFGFGLNFGPRPVRRNLDQGISPVVIDLSSEDDDDDEEDEPQPFTDDGETLNQLNALESEETQNNNNNNATAAAPAEESDFELARRLQEEENRAYQEHVNEVARRTREVREAEAAAAARQIHAQIPRFPQFAHRIHLPGVILQGHNHHTAPAIHFLPAALTRVLQQRRQQQAAGMDTSLFALNFVDRDFDERDYDLLLRLDDQAPKKTAAEVEVIPAVEAKENMGTCCICLSDIETGEQAKTLLCKHNFHADCIDKYLKEYADTCPICKASVKEQVQNLQPAEVKKPLPVSNPTPAPASNSQVRPTHLFFNNHRHRQAPPPQPQHVLTLPASLGDNSRTTTSIPTNIDEQLRRHRRNRRRL